MYHRRSLRIVQEPGHASHLLLLISVPSMDASRIAANRQAPQIDILFVQALVMLDFLETVFVTVALAKKYCLASLRGFPSLLSGYVKEPPNQTHAQNEHCSAKVACGYAW